MSNDFAHVVVVTAIGTVFEVWVSVLVVVVVVVAMEVIAVLVVVVVSDSVRSLFPEVLRISCYDNDANALAGVYIFIFSIHL